MSLKKIKLVVLISGTGRSLQNMIEHINAGKLSAEIVLVIASSPDAKGLQFAEMASIPIAIIEKNDFEPPKESNTAATDAQAATPEEQEKLEKDRVKDIEDHVRKRFSEAIFEQCRKVNPDYVVMAGFLKLLDIPADFYHRVLNIHPSLIPAFSGRGFYGRHVHEEVLAYGVKLTGCTVHFVNKDYDRGPVLLQKAIPVLEDDTTESLNDRVFELERIAYPEALQLLAEGRVAVMGRKVAVKQK